MTSTESNKKIRMDRLDTEDNRAQRAYMVEKSLRYPCIICGSEHHKAISQGIAGDQSTIEYECPAALQEKWDPDLHYSTYMSNVALDRYKFAQMYSFQRDQIVEAFVNLKQYGYGKTHSKMRWFVLRQEILKICDEQKEAESRFTRHIEEMDEEETEET